MAPLTGARIAIWSARRSLGVKLLESSPFSSTSPSQLFTNGNLETVKWRSEAFSRSFHGTRWLESSCYYDVLGIGENASASEIKTAFHSLAKKFHPDMNKDDAHTKRKFQEVQRAYEILKDYEKRNIYDQVGHDAFVRAVSEGGAGDSFGAGFEGFNWGSIFEDIDPDKKVGDDVKVCLELSFMEAIQGCKKTVTFETDITCKSCNGTGVPRGTIPQTCLSCRGSGVEIVQEGNMRLEFNCSRCRGSGKIVKSFCKSCKGRKTIKGTKSVKLDVMSGVDNDETIRVYGGGGANPHNDKPGALYATIKVREDPVFQRKGSDIHIDAALSAGQAMSGGTIRVPTLTGDVVVKVPKGTQPGQKVVLKGKGIKTRKSVGFGNQYVHFNVANDSEEHEENGERAAASG